MDGNGSQSSEQASLDALKTVADEEGKLFVDIVDVAGNLDVISTTISTQASEFVKLSEAVGSVAESNRNIVNAAMKSRQLSSSASENVAESKQSIDAAVSEIHSLIEGVSSTESTLSGLQKALSEVGKIAASINQIAGQTNLLALNATIEAARAGDAGRGFAVVAGEVKTLAGQTSEATQNIERTLKELENQANLLISQGESNTGLAGRVSEGTANIGSAIDLIASSIEEIDSETGRIVGEAERISDDSADLEDTAAQIREEAERSSATLAEATERTKRLVDGGEWLMNFCAKDGANEVDKPYVDYVTKIAAQISEQLDAEIDSGRDRLEDLFDPDYQPIPGSNPSQVSNRCTETTDRVFTPVQEAALAFSPTVVYCASINTDGYLPTHNKQFSQPQSDDPSWNHAHCRNRKIYRDRTAKKVSANKEPFLLLTYRRDMGGGNFALMREATSPIWVKGRHWGGVRLAYKPD